MNSSSISNNNINYIVVTTLVNLSSKTIKNSRFLNNKNDYLVYYPNPVEDKLFISNVEKSFEVKIYNELGQLIGNCYIKNNYIDFSKLKKGIYLIETIGESIKRFKVIKN